MIKSTIQTRVCFAFVVFVSLAAYYVTQGAYAQVSSTSLQANNSNSSDYETSTLPGQTPPVTLKMGYFEVILNWNPNPIQVGKPTNFAMHFQTIWGMFLSGTNYNFTIADLSGRILEQKTNQNASGVGDASQQVTFNQSGWVRIEFDINHSNNFPIEKSFTAQGSYYIMVGLYLTSNTYVSPPIRVPAVSGPTPLNVAIQPIWSDEGNVYFKIAFYQKDNQVLLQHVRYNFKVYNQSSGVGGDEVKPIYDNVDSYIHNCPVDGFCDYNDAPNGTDIVPAVPLGDTPLKLNQGNYRIEVLVYAIGHGAVDPANVTKFELPIAATPEFSVWQVGVVLVTSMGVIAFLMRHKLGSD